MLPELFFTINYWVGIGLAIISLSLCSLFILIIITHRECHNCANILTCNTCVAVALYFIFRFIESIYALRDDWQSYQPACVFLAYCVLGLIATLCFSFPTHAISRLFFAVFYKHRFLLTWRTHWILIAMNWIISFTLPIAALFHRNGYVFEIESRNCVVNSKITSITIYVIFSMFVIPVGIVTVVYGTIIYRVHQSTRRIAPTTVNAITTAAQNKSLVPNAKRELKIVQKMFVQTGIISAGGLLYLILVIWIATQQQPPPESFYLLSFGLISVFTTTKTIDVFLSNSGAKKLVLGYIF